MKKILIVSILLLVSVIVLGNLSWKKEQAKFANLSVEVKNEVAEVVDKPENFYSKLENGYTVTVVFLGDSTTEQNETTEGELNHVGLLTEWLYEKYPEQFTVVNAGVSGNSIVQMRDRLQIDVLSKNPDMVIISSGLNDSSGTLKISLDEYEKTYRSVIDEILASGDIEVILRTPNLTMNSMTNDLMETYIEATKKLAEKYELGYFDFYSLEKSAISENEIDQSKLMKDTVHPNANGQEYIFENFKSYFEKEIFKQP